MRLGLISDLHGNAHSLRAVLHDCSARGVDQIVCLGDVATLGPRPNEVIAILQDAGVRCILGNHDAFMLEPELIHTYSEVPVVVDAVDWCRDQMSKSDLAFISRFDANIRFKMDGELDVLLFHGSPRSHMKDLLATTSPKELDECLGDESATLMAGGHTHIQMLRKHRGITLVNPGSVGMPFKEHVQGRAPEILSCAEYAIIEVDHGDIEVSMHRVDMDKRALRAAAHESRNPICRYLEEQYA